MWCICWGGGDIHQCRVFKFTFYQNRERLKSHLNRGNELLSKHGEYKKDVADLEEQLELITRDSTTLENSFDELHQQYVKLKTFYQQLSERNKIIQQYAGELKAWSSGDVQRTEQIQRESQELQQRCVMLTIAVEPNRC